MADDARDRLTLYTIYRNPRDLESLAGLDALFVARRWHVGTDGTLQLGQIECMADSLEGVRSMLPRGLHRLERSAEDDPAVVETWI